jgi:hypothetical protein
MRAPCLLVLVCAAVPVAGCGGHAHSPAVHSTAARDRGGGDGAEEAARAAADRLPPSDRLAFYELATVDGLVRSRAVVSGPGRAPRVSAADVSDARRRLTVLAPRDRGLRALRRDLGVALARVARRQAGARRAVLSATDAVYAGLVRYERAHPAVAGLVPD